MLINDHSYLVLSPHPSPPLSRSTYHALLSLLLATGPVQLSGVLLVVPTSWMASGRRACQSGLLPSVGCSKMNLKTSDLKPSSLKTPQARSPSRSLQISSDGKTIQDQTFKLQATTVSVNVRCAMLYLRLPINASRNPQVANLVFSDVPTTLSIAQSAYPYTVISFSH